MQVTTSEMRSTLKDIVKNKDWNVYDLGITQTTTQSQRLLEGSHMISEWSGVMDCQGFLVVCNNKDSEVVPSANVITNGKTEYVSGRKLMTAEDVLKRLDTLKMESTLNTLSALDRTKKKAQYYNLNNLVESYGGVTEINDDNATEAFFAIPKHIPTPEGYMWHIEYCGEIVAAGKTWANITSKITKILETVEQALPKLAEIKKVKMLNVEVIKTTAVDTVNVGDIITFPVREGATVGQPATEEMLQKAYKVVDLRPGALIICPLNKKLKETGNKIYNISAFKIEQFKKDDTIRKLVKDVVPTQTIVSELKNVTGKVDLSTFTEETGDKNELVYNPKMFEIKKINGINVLHLNPTFKGTVVLPEHCSSCYAMFAYAKNICKVDLSKLDTRGIKDMTVMFAGNDFTKGIVFPDTFDNSLATEQEFVFFGSRFSSAVKMSGNYYSEYAKNPSKIFLNASTDDTLILDPRNPEAFIRKLQGVKYEKFKETTGSRNTLLYNPNIFEVVTLFNKEVLHVRDDYFGPVELPINCSSCFGMFSKLSDLNNISLDGLDTTGVKDMTAMFVGTKIPDHYVLPNTFSTENSNTIAACFYASSFGYGVHFSENFSITDYMIVNQLFDSCTFDPMFGIEDDDSEEVILEKLKHTAINQAMSMTADGECVEFGEVPVCTNLFDID